MGYRGPMQRVERTARIGAPPSEVFAYISDLDKLSEWQSGVTAAERTSPGEMRAGATASVTREVMGRRVVAPLTVTEFDQPNRLGIGSEVSGVRADALLELAEADGGSATDIAFSMEIRGSGLTSFMEPMIAGAAGGDIDASLDRVRARFSAEA